MSLEDIARSFISACVYELQTVQQISVHSRLMFVYIFELALRLRSAESKSTISIFD